MSNFVNLIVPMVSSMNNHCISTILNNIPNWDIHPIISLLSLPLVVTYMKVFMISLLTFSFAVNSYKIYNMYRDKNRCELKKIIVDSLFNIIMLITILFFNKIGDTIFLIYATRKILL